MKFVNEYFSLSFPFIARAIAGADTDSHVQWNLPSTPNKAQAVYQGYIGFGIEMKSFPDYAGVDAPNQFSNYLLSQLAIRTGNAPIHVRIGGTSGDNTVLDMSLNDTWKYTGNATECRLHTNVTLGKAWFKNTFTNLNASFTRYTIDVPLARLNKTNGIAFASACINAMPSKTQQLATVEIGNEPNLYTNYPQNSCSPNSDRGSNWNAQDYSHEWSTYAKNLTTHVKPLKQSGRNDWFQALGLSSSYKMDAWNFGDFWDRLSQGGFIKTVSQHYYQLGANGTVQDYPVDHRNTVNIMETKFRNNINFVKNQNASFILGEVGTIISKSNSDENQQLFNSLGSALWVFDFLLYGMTMGIERVSMQMGTGFKIAAWQPVKEKAVHGSFYGLVACADFIGGQGNLKIQKLSTDGHPNVVAYAGFNDGKLSKVAILNLNFWHHVDGSPQRPQSDITLMGLGNAKRVRVSRLTAPNGAMDQNIHWAGKRWTAEDDGREYQDGEQMVKIDVRSGSLVRNVTVGASEAVLIKILDN